MAIATTMLSVIIPIKNIERCRGIGGFKGILKIQKDWTGKKVLYDEYLYKDGAMSSGDIEDIVEFWKKQGLTPTETKDGKTYWKDLCVVDMLGGATMPCDWLEFDYKTFTVWLKGKPKGETVIPDRLKKNKIDEIDKSTGKVYVVGTQRKHTELDGILDEIVLEKYYETHNEKRTPEKDKGILKRSYLKEMK